MKYNGPKWEDVRPLIKEKFREASITRCELRWEGCQDTVFLTFAHSLRRRRIMTKEQMEETCLFCQHCHSLADAQKEYETYALIRKIINKRPIQVKSIYDGNKDVGGLATVFENAQYKASHAKKRYRNKPQGKRVLPGSERGGDDGLHQK